MRISDWSSDVCSSDLCRIVALARPNRTKELAAPGQADPFTLASFTIKETTDFVRRMLPKATQETLEAFHLRTFGNPRVQAYQLATTDSLEEIVRGLGPGGQTVSQLIDQQLAAGRSEEHTSELQSLLRISYAVFCLKKKKANTKSHMVQIRLYLQSNTPRTAQIRHQHIDR